MKAIVLIEKVCRSVKQTVEGIRMDTLEATKECDSLNRIMNCDGLIKGYIVEEVEIINDFEPLGFNVAGEELAIATVRIAGNEYQLSTVILDGGAEMDSKEFADFEECEITEI